MRKVPHHGTLQPHSEGAQRDGLRPAGGSRIELIFPFSTRHME
jgi:hypothetical protein